MLLRGTLLYLLLAFPQLLLAENDIFLGDLQADSADALLEKNEETIVSAENDSRLQLRQSRLGEIYADIIDQRNEITHLYAEIEAQQDALKLEHLQTRLETATARLDRLQKSFEEIAIGGVDTASMSDEVLGSTAGIESSVRDIFKPLVINLRRVTERPRKIEQLRSEVDFYRSSLARINVALARLSELNSTGLSPELKAGIEVMKERWRQKKELYEHRLQSAELQLEEQFSDNTSLFGELGTASLEFLRGRGFNIFLAIVAFTLTLVVIVVLRRLLRTLAHSRTGSAHFSGRLFLLLINVFSVLLAFMMAMGVLYIRGDWLILGILILFLVGIGWSLKNTLPDFIDEARLMLNMGVVREGERVLFQGVAWKVENIGLYSTLVNPLLAGGSTRLTLAQLRTLNARPLDGSETWFPTRQGDFVLLHDDDYAQVLMQSADTVQLQIPGKSTCYYQTADFLSARPVNLSESGFSLYMNCYLDYQHRYQLNAGIRAALEKQVRSALEGEAFGIHLETLQVSFRKAERFALNLGVFAAFSGEAAADYIQIRRSLRQIIFDTSNLNGWSLAYSELKVNMGKSLADRSKNRNAGVHDDRHQGSVGPTGT